MKKILMCPICDTGHLDSQSKTVEIEYRGHRGLVESHYARCDACGAEQATTAQMSDNKQAAIAFRKMVDGLQP
ncbi:MAG: YgiT-type zinc finger protein [Castellaniella sp.]